LLHRRRPSCGDPQDPIASASFHDEPWNFAPLSEPHAEDTFPFPLAALQDAAETACLSLSAPTEDQHLRAASPQPGNFGLQHNTMDSAWRTNEKPSDTCSDHVTPYPLCYKRFAQRHRVTSTETSKKSFAVLVTLQPGFSQLQIRCLQVRIQALHKLTDAFPAKRHRCGRNYSRRQSPT
jgi:hypothetical protein